MSSALLTAGVQRRARRVLMRRVINPAVARLLRSPLHDLISGRVTLIEWTGRRSGRSGATPVNFAWDGSDLILVSRRGRVWWRNLIDGAPVRIWIAGRAQRGAAWIAPSAEASAALTAVYAAATGGREIAAEKACRKAADTVVIRVALDAHKSPEAALLRENALLRCWVVACSAGELAGFVAPALAGAVVAAGDVPALPAFALLVCAGAVEGGLLGLAQAWALRQADPQIPTIRWVRATAAGAAAAWAIGLLPSTLGDRLDDVPSALMIAVGIPLGLTLVLVMGVLQARVLRGHVRKAWRWAPATAVAWTFGLWAAAPIWALWEEGQAFALVVAIGIAGALVMALGMATVSGKALAHMFDEHPQPAVIHRRHAADEHGSDRQTVNS